MKGTRKKYDAKFKAKVAFMNQPSVVAFEVEAGHGRRRAEHIPMLLRSEPLPCPDRDPLVI